MGTTASTVICDDDSRMGTGGAGDMGAASNDHGRRRRKEGATAEPGKMRPYIIVATLVVRAPPLSTTAGGAVLYSK